MKIDYLAWAVMFIALAGLFWNVNTGFNLVHERIDRLQAETNVRFEAVNVRFEAVNTRFDQMFDRMDRMQAETSARFEAVNTRFDQVFDRMDRMQTEFNRHFEGVLEAIMSFDRRVSRNEGQIEIIREQLQAEGSP